MSQQNLDLVGQVFHRLTVIASTDHRAKNGSKFWRCRCECGNESEVISSMLRNGGVRSCGCLRIENSIKAMTTHGKSRTPEYRTWIKIKMRCTDSTFEDWMLYGGRGIKVCDRWMNSFEAFFEDMGLKPSPAHSIDRINSNGDYSPDNCRWATDKEQNRNTSQNHHLTLNGMSKTIAEWAEDLGMPYVTLCSRVNNYGWSDEKALTTPYKPRGPYRTKIASKSQHPLQE